MSSHAGAEIERLIQLLAKLPGLGPRSARRSVLHLVDNKAGLMEPLSAALEQAIAVITKCETCGNIDTCSPCGLCQDPRRRTGRLCIVETVGDLWAMERAKAVDGSYHVLGGVLSPLDGIGPDDLNIQSLLNRVEAENLTEIIIAVNATVEGQTTAHYISELLEEFNVTVTRLAHGVPVGGELDYLDEGTLSAAMRQRRPI